MTAALTFADGWIRSLQLRNHCLYARQMNLNFLTIARSESNLRAFEKLEIPSVRTDDSLLIIGKEAENYSELLRQPLQSLMPGGHVPINDPPARQLLSLILDHLLTPEVGKGSLCCVSDWLSYAGGFVSREQRRANRLIEQIIELRGASKLSLSPARAVILAEMVKEAFDGIALHLQTELFCAAVTRHGVPLMDEELTVHEDLRTQLMSREFGSNQLDRDECRELVRDTIGPFLGALSRNQGSCSFGRPLTLVVSGHCLQNQTLSRVIHEELSVCRSPIPIGVIRFTADPFAVARGCVIHAELERRALSGCSAAASDCASVQALQTA